MQVLLVEIEIVGDTSARRRAALEAVKTTADAAFGSVLEAEMTRWGGVIRNANNAKSPVNAYVSTRAVRTVNPSVSE